MSAYDYQIAVNHLRGVPVDALLMAAVIGADTANLARLEHGWPELVAETRARFNAPGGTLDADQPHPLVNRTAYVIPADPDEPCRTVQWSGDNLLPMLRREIACDWVEAVRVEVDGAETVVGWVDEEGRFADDRVDNRRFGDFAAKVGQRHLAVFGNVVLTGDDDDGGETLGLSDELLAALPAAIEGATR